MTVRIPLVRTPTSKTDLVRDEHGPGDRHEEVHVHTTIYDDEHLERNKRIRLEGLLPKGRKIPVLDGADIQFAFSIPPIAYQLLLKKEKELLSQINDRDASIREKAARQFAIKYPQYCIMAGNR